MNYLITFDGYDYDYDYSILQVGKLRLRKVTYILKGLIHVIGWVVQDPHSLVPSFLRHLNQVG